MSKLLRKYSLNGFYPKKNYAFQLLTSLQAVGTGKIEWDSGNGKYRGLYQFQFCLCLHYKQVSFLSLCSVSIDFGFLGDKQVKRFCVVGLCPFYIFHLQQQVIREQLFSLETAAGLHVIVVLFLDLFSFTHIFQLVCGLGRKMDWSFITQVGHHFFAAEPTSPCFMMILFGH